MSDLQEIVERLVRETGAPGAVVGVLQGDHVQTAAAGVANRTTGAPMTPETLFLTGSITKVWVTTLVMSLVDAGLVELDAPVRRYLPDFRVADAEATQRITVRHLLTHASGIDGADFGAELGRGPDVTRQYVELLTDLSQLHAPGAYASYCNPGFVLAGRIIEVVTGESFDDAFRHRLIEPLGLASTVLTPDEAILRSVAIGHFPGEDGSHVPTKRFLLPESLAAAGATLLTTVADTLRFARVHLGDGSPLIAPESAAAMAAHQLDLPVPELGSFGLGWLRDTRGPQLMLTHGGGSLGGVAQLYVVPESQVAYIAFVNTTGSADLHPALQRNLLHGLLGVPEAPPVPLPDAPGDQAYFAGCYRRYGCECTFTPDGEDLVLETVWEPGVLSEYATGQPTKLPLKVHGREALSLLGIAPVAYAVPGDGTDHPEFLFSGARLHRRV